MTEQQHSYPYAAQDLDEAWNNFDPHPLRGLGLERFYVERPDHSDRDLLLDGLRQGVKQAEKEFPHADTSASNNANRSQDSHGLDRRRIKFLVLGHPGCGKSTELNWLAWAVAQDDELRDKVFTVRYDFGEWMETTDPDFVEVAVSMVLALYDEMERLDIALGETPLERIYEWVEEEGWDQAKTLGAGMELSAAVANLFSVGITGKGESRNERRGKVRKYLPELIGLVNDLIARIEATTGRHVLFIVDELDKVGPQEAALRIFRDHRIELTDLNCFAIYTAPISLALEADFGMVEERFEKPYFVPMFRVHDKNWKQGPEEAADVETLREIIYRRAAPQLFSLDVVDAAIQVTGGVVRELMKVLRECCLRQIRAGGPPITAATLERVKQDYKTKLWRMLYQTDYEQLAKVAVSQQRTDVEPRHLQSLCVLEYPRQWCDVHPLVRELLIERDYLPAD